MPGVNVTDKPWSYPLRRNAMAPLKDDRYQSIYVGLDVSGFIWHCMATLRAKLRGWCNGVSIETFSFLQQLRRVNSRIECGERRTVEHHPMPRKAANYRWRCLPTRVVAAGLCGEDDEIDQSIAKEYVKSSLHPSGAPRQGDLPKIFLVGISSYAD